MSNSPRRKKIKQLRRLMKQMSKAFSPEEAYRVWAGITAAQQRMIDRRDPAAFDLLAIARESLSSPSDR